MKVWQWAWHVHHRILVEELQGPNGLIERQSFIKTEKPYRERERRLRLLKVVKNQELLASLMASMEKLLHKLPDGIQGKIRARILQAINDLHAHECKECPWDGHTIFPTKRKK